MLVVNQRHELHILIGVVFQTVELADLNHADVTRADACDGLVVVDKVSLALEYVVRLGVAQVLMPADARARRQDDLGIEPPWPRSSSLDTI